MAEPDILYHCAAMLGVQNTEEHPDVCRQINEFGTENVLKAAYAANVKTFVFLSSSEVYGNGFDFKPFSETSPLLGDNVYAHGKKLGEQMALAYADRMKVVVPRMFNCYGVGQVSQFFIPKVIVSCGIGRNVPIYGSLKNKRSYLFGHDAAKHLINIAVNAPNMEVVNVGHPTPATLEDVFFEIKRRMKSKSLAVVRASDRGVYDDRTVSRDVPNRLAVLGKLRLYSNHEPTDLYAAIGFAVRAAFTLRPDWTYRRELL
jgi:UDP-glucose 4-epimerase